MGVKSTQGAESAVAEIALVGNAIECALCRVVRHDGGHPAFYAARDRNRGHYLECMDRRGYLGSRELVTRPRFNVKSD